MDISQQVATEGNLQGFGQHSAQQVEDLQKALSIGQNYGTTAPNTLAGGSALSVENLDRTLKIVTHSLEHLKLWKDIKRDPTTQTVTEYNVQNSYGQEVSPFFAMGGTPTGTDANYERDFAQVKYLGTLGAVQHNLTLIQGAHGAVVAREVKNKTIELLSRNERAMFEADSSVQTLEYDGIEKQIRDKEQTAKYKATSFEGYEDDNESVILDIRGGAFTEDVAEDAALINVNNFGQAMDMYMATDVHSKFSRDFYSKQRTLPGATLTSGNRIKEHTGSLDFRYKPSLFNRPKKKPLAIAVSAQAAPTLANPLTPAHADSKFLVADAGDYSYRIAAVYDDGETLASIATAAIAVVAGDEVTIEATFTGAPLYLNVYRAPKGTVADHLFIKRIAVGASAATISIDKNFTIEGTAKAFLLMHDLDVLCWKQLGSMIKYDLAVVDTSYRWLQLLYGTPLVTAPRKNVIIENIA